MRNCLPRLLLIVAAGFFVSCSDKPDTIAISETVSKVLITPKIDTKTYRALVLKNGLRVMLVNDPEATKAAASLNVDVGSGADPKGREGLAHFLEHMLFLGTEKYPEAGEYQAYISSQGGQHNAYTAFNDTNYFFDVDAQAFEPTLDRFAQFFIAPLFSQEYLERERNAVNSEYAARIDNEMRRYLDVVKVVMNPLHPFTKFSVGSLDTLHTDGLAKDVRALYKHYYVGSNMSLALVSPDSLEQQEAWVQALFSAVPSGAVADFPEAEPLFNVGVLPALLEVKPKKEQRSLSLSFPIPNVYKHRLEKPLLLLGHLLGHEGQGSLFQVLRQKGWAESLSAGNFLDDNGEGLFTVSMNLTETGAVQRDAVVEAVFSAIELIRNDGPKAWRYQELVDVSALQFDYQPQSQVLSLARTFAASMDDYPQRYWLRGPYELQKFDPVLFASLLERLNPNNALIALVAPEVKTTEVSPWYKTPYRKFSVSVAQLQRWNSPSALSGLGLPLKNQFVPSDLSIGLDEHDIPVLMVDERSFKIWHQSLNRFNEPRAFVKLDLSMGSGRQSVEQSAVMAVAAKMLNDAVNLTLYDAKAIGYSFGVSNSAFGLQVSAYGYDQKLNELLAATLAPIKSVNWTQSQYLRARDELVRRWKNAKMKPPYRVLAGVQYADYVHPAWRKSQLAKSIEAMSFGGFLEHWQGLSRFDHVTGLIVGNVDVQQAEQLAATMHQFKPKTKAATLKPRSVVAAVNKNQDASTLRLASADSAVLSYLQSPVDGYQGRALSALTASIYEADFYGQLRTEQQLGYVVHLANRLLDKTPGLMMLVQSPSHSPEHIITAINQFWALRLNEKPATKEQFLSHKQSLGVSLLKPAKNIAEQAGRNWRNINDEVFSFDQQQQLVQALDKISYERWCLFVSEVFALNYDKRHDYIAVPK